MRQPCNQGNNYNNYDLQILTKCLLCIYTSNLYGIEK